MSRHEWVKLRLMLNIKNIKVKIFYLNLTCLKNILSLNLYFNKSSHKGQLKPLNIHYTK